MAIKNLQYSTLSYLLQVPVILKDDFIIHGMIILLYGSFSQDIMNKDYKYRHENALYTFAALLRAIPPPNKYPLVASLIRENFWHMQEEPGFKIVRPLKFLELLLDLNYQIFEDENILLGIYENYLWYSADFDPMIVNNTTHYIYDEHYIELKNITIIFFMNDENFGSKILPNKDVIVYEKLLDTASLLCFCKQLIYKIIHTAPKELSLKDKCREANTPNFKKKKYSSFYK